MKLYWAQISFDEDHPTISISFQGRKHTMATEYQALPTPYSDLDEEFEEESDEEEEQEIFVACKNWKKANSAHFDMNLWRSLGTTIDKGTPYDVMVQMIAGQWCKWCYERAETHHCHYLINSIDYWKSTTSSDYPQVETPILSSPSFWTAEEWLHDYEQHSVPQEPEGWPDLSDEPVEDPWSTDPEEESPPTDLASVSLSDSNIFDEGNETTMPSLDRGLDLNLPVSDDLMDSKTVNLLTPEAIDAMHLGDNLAPEEQEVLKSLILKYSDIFACSSQDLQRANVAPFKIDTGDAAPLKENPRQMDPKRMEIIDNKLQELLDNGVIEPCASPWAAPVVVVQKEGKEPRLCMDYRRLNKVTKKNSYPLLRIDDILQTLGQSKYFTTLDAKSGYHQIPIAIEDQEKTVFTTHRGTYKWTGMPFGLCNAPAAYQSIMDTLFHDIMWQFVMNYIDDTVIYSKTFQEHIQHLEEVFSRFRKVNLKLHIKKCFFGFAHVDLLGHHISDKGTWTKKDIIEKIQAYPAPKTVTQVRAFLGLAGWYRAFVKDFAIIAIPLNKLTRKGVPFIWTEECEAAFQELKKNLMTPPILARPDFSKPFIMHTDASTLGVGAILGQKDDKGREQVVCYRSRGLNKAESNYSATELELLAVVWAVKKNYIYLHHLPVDIYMDHAALKGLLTSRHLKDYNKKANRWILDLQDINFKIHHRAGKKHQHVDALSRLGF